MHYLQGGNSLVKRKIGVVLILVIVLLRSPYVVKSDERRLVFNVVDVEGDWDETTPMYVETTDPDDYKFVQINATNINDTNQLTNFQYMKYIVDFIDYELPTVSKPDIGYVFYNIVNFTDDNTVIRVSYGWNLEWDTGVVLYESNLRFFVNSTLVFNEYFATYGKSHQLEIQMWRTKSDQVGVYYRAGEESTEENLIILSQIEHWGIGNFTYWFNDDEVNTGYFSARFEDLSIQSGSDEGIQDPIENTDWGFFEPIRQIGLFILNLFVGLTKLILPSSVENLFEDLGDSLDDFVVPLTEMVVFVFSNFLELIILVNLALLMNGVTRAEKGDIAGILMPFFTFYGFMFSLAFTVINFIIAVIKALIEALPFI